ncbi:hypothetical protein Apa02nite_087430 [Actinoplanes palleronii]|uniref:Uncharacterized protein n=1 Tax=Actinoplanes palleronii TaxID=113570 RepID=A0ABQ4BPN0_9ACTN|nr:hypothetical protein Apa02nite_087430 [Actinoplanes palleronii]
MAGSDLPADRSRAAGDGEVAAEQVPAGAASVSAARGGPARQVVGQVPLSASVGMSRAARIAG